LQKEYPIFETRKWISQEELLRSKLVWENRWKPLDYQIRIGK